MILWKSLEMSGKCAAYESLCPCSDSTFCCFVFGNMLVVILTSIDLMYTFISPLYPQSVYDS